MLRTVLKAHLSADCAAATDSAQFQTVVAQSLLRYIHTCSLDGIIVVTLGVDDDEHVFNLSKTAA